MPVLPQGRVYYPGIQEVIDCTATMTLGPMPSAITLTIAPQREVPPLIGTLRIVYGSVDIKFTNCRIDLATMRYSTSGQVTEVTLHDRRWKWVGRGAISGWYNVRKCKSFDNYDIKAGTERTPRELASLCMDAMGERGSDIRGLPTDPRPEIDWDSEQPAHALQDLCENLGCRIALGTDDVVRIVRVGQGKELPQGDVMDAGLTWDFPDSPSKVVVQCGRTLYQNDFDLEAVGLDVDGSVKPIDKLTYRPDAGWGQIDAYFNGVGVAGANGASLGRELAKRTVWRWYRVKAPLTVSGYRQEIRDLDYIDLQDEQVDKVKRSDLNIVDQKQTALKTSDRTIRKPAEVFGTWCPNYTDVRNVTGTTNRPAGDFARLMADGLFREFSIDTDQRIVVFQHPIFKNLRDSGESNSNVSELVRAPADIKLRTACCLRDPDTGGWVHESVEKAINRNDSGKPRVLKHPEIVARFSGGRWINQSSATEELNYYLSAAVQRYVSTYPATAKYAGVLDVSCDGAIQQVTWHIGKPTYTVINRNNEDASSAIPYRERVSLWKLGQAIDWWTGVDRSGKQGEGIPQRKM